MEKEIVLSAGKGIGNYWRDVWRYRGLFYFLSWRDILVRYKQTAIGIAWSFIRPFLTMIVFTIIFGRIGKFPSNGVPYPILVFCATLPWQFFSNAFSDASNSLLNNSNMLTKVYFPRIVMPVSAIIVSLVDFVISFFILIGLMIYYQYVPDLKMVLLPFFLIIALIFSLGAGFWISSLNIKYRDFKFIIPFIVQFGLYVSPVGFTSEVVPQKWRLLYALNPMVGVIDGFRWAVLGNFKLYMPGLLISLFTVVIIFVSGIWYFRKTERSIADII